MDESQQHWLRPTAGGVLLAVTVRAAARRNQLGPIHDGRLRISVTTAPEKGKANQAVVRLLANTLAIPKNQITIVQGMTNPHKSIWMNSSCDEIERRLLPLLNLKQ